MRNDTLVLAVLAAAIWQTLGPVQAFVAVTAGASIVALWNAAQIRAERDRAIAMAKITRKEN